MSIQISGTDVINNARKGIFQSANVGAFNPGNRPGSAATGDLIYNTSTAQLEVWNGSAWEKACGAVEVAATGGNLTYDHQGNRVHIFSSPGTFSVSTGGVVEYVIVAGGGSGRAGGGGAGGVLTGYFTVSSSPGSYPITIGAGDAGKYPTSYQPGTTGNPSTAFGNTAFGGGCGGWSSNLQTPYNIPVPLQAQPGGSGGGGPIRYQPGPFPSGSLPIAFPYFFGGAGTSGQGRDGGSGLYVKSPTKPSDNGAGGGGAAAEGESNVPGSIPSIPAVIRGGNGISLTGWGIPPSYGDPGSNWGLPSDVTAFGGGGGGETTMYVELGTRSGTDASTYQYNNSFGGGGKGANAIPPLLLPYTPVPVRPTLLPSGNGLAFSGGGGGGGKTFPAPGTYTPYSSGGSGIVLVRYRKTP